MSVKNSELFKKENIKKFFIGVLLGIAATALLIIIASAVFLVFNISRSFAGAVATVCIAAGAFLSAFYSARKIGEKGYLTGLITGLFYFLCVTSAALAVNKGGLTSNTLFHFIIIMLSSLIGGITGVNKSSKKYI